MNPIRWWMIGTMRMTERPATMRGFPRKPLEFRPVSAQLTLGQDKGFARRRGLWQGKARGKGAMTFPPICQDCYPSPWGQFGLSPVGLPRFSGFLAKDRCSDQGLNGFGFHERELSLKSRVTEKHYGGRAPCVKPFLFRCLLQPEPCRPAFRSRVSRVCWKPSRAALLRVLSLARLSLTIRTKTLWLALPSVRLVGRLPAVSRACRAAPIRDLTAEGPSIRHSGPSGRFVRVAFLHAAGEAV
jgi:hypothetical protein